MESATTLLYVPSTCSFAIILMGKRELVALLSMSSWCLVIIVWLFLAMPWVCLQFVIVVFAAHTHLLFFLCSLALASVVNMVIWFMLEPNIPEEPEYVEKISILYPCIERSSTDSLGHDDISSDL